MVTFRRSCDREPDTLEAVTEGRWPELCDEGLRAHVAACPVCSDLAQTALALQDDRRAGMRDAEVPPGALVFWRAELRARREAAQVAERPIAFMHALAVVGTLAGVLALVGAALTIVSSAAGWMPSAEGLLPSFSLAGLFEDPEAGSMIRWAVPLGLMVWIVLAPVAVYLAFARD